MTTSTIFSVLAPTPAAPVEGAQTSAEPTGQGFSNVYNEQSAQLEPEQSQQSTAMGAAIAQVMEQQDGESLPNGLMLEGQTVATEEAILPALMESETQEALPQLMVSQMDLVTPSQEGQGEQGQALPMMAMVMPEQETETVDTGEFDRIMQQRTLNPEVQKVEVTTTANQMNAQSAQNNPLAATTLVAASNEQVVKNTLTAEAKGVSSNAALASANVSTPVDDKSGISTEMLEMEPTVEEVPTEYVRPASLGKATNETTITSMAAEPQVEDLDVQVDDGLMELKPQSAELKQDSQLQRAQQQEQALKAQGNQAVLNKIDVSPKDNRWTEIISERIAIMNSENIQSARIQLDPPELGLLEIKIRVQQDNVSVAFNSGHQVVREALDSQSARLKELMESQGINLTDVNVSGQSTQQGQQGEGSEEGQDGSATGLAADGMEGDIEDGSQQQTIATSNNLVDDFA